MTGRRVVGIDPSLAKCGIGIVDEDAGAYGVQLAHPRPVEKAKRVRYGLTATPTLLERRDCIVRAAREVVEHAHGAALVVIYQAYTGAIGQGDARHDTLALWWEIVAGVQRAEVPVAVLHDSTARKALTGKGTHGDKSANKVATALAVRSLYGEVEIATDDVADALSAAHLGAVALGWAVPTLGRHADVRWSEWPSLPDPAAVGALA